MVLAESPPQLSDILNGLLVTRRMLGARMMILVVIAVSFPRPIVREDFEIVAGFFAALLATAFEKVGESVDVLAVVVGEGRQAIGIPAQLIQLWAAAGEAQDVGGR